MGNKHILGEHDVHISTKVANCTFWVDGSDHNFAFLWKRRLEGGAAYETKQKIWAITIWIAFQFVNRSIWVPRFHRKMFTKYFLHIQWFEMLLEINLQQHFFMLHQDIKTTLGNTRKTVAKTRQNTDWSLSFSYCKRTVLPPLAALSFLQLESA